MPDFAARTKITPADTAGAAKPKIEADVAHLDWCMDVIKRFPDADAKVGSTLDVVVVKIADEKLPRDEAALKAIYEGIALGPGQRHATECELNAYSKPDGGWDGRSTVVALGETLEHPAYGLCAPMLFHRDADGKIPKVSGAGLWVARHEPLPLFLVVTE